MYACMYVCMYVCMCVYVLYVYVFVFVCVCICICVCIMFVAGGHRGDERGRRGAAAHQGRAEQRKHLILLFVLI